MSAVATALEPGSWKMARPTDGLPSSVQLTSWFLAPSSTRRHVAQAGDLPLPAGLDDDVAELGGIASGGRGR